MDSGTMSYPSGLEPNTIKRGMMRWCSSGITRAKKKLKSIPHIYGGTRLRHHSVWVHSMLCRGWPPPDRQAHHPEDGKVAVERGPAGCLCPGCLAAWLPPTIPSGLAGQSRPVRALVRSEPVALQHPASPRVASRRVLSDLPFSASAQVASHQVTRRTMGTSCSGLVQVGGGAAGTVLSTCRLIGW